MYKGEASRPNTLLWAFTVNGPVTSQDMADRCVPIRLDRPDPDPGWDDRVRAYIHEHRRAVMADVGALLVAGPPATFGPSAGGPPGSVTCSASCPTGGRRRR
jgi:hypothetical protein